MKLLLSLVLVIGSSFIPPVFSKQPVFPKFIARGSHNKALVVRGGDTEKECDRFSVDPTVALGLSTAAIGIYAAESAFPEYFSEKYTAAKEFSGNGAFWEGWFGLGLFQNALLTATAAVFGDAKIKKKM
jgi:hypothetical protein